MTYFTASVADVQRIEECARECCAEHGERKTCGPLNWEHYRGVWEKLIADGMGAMLLCEDGGRIVGGIGGAKYQEPLTGLWRAAQVFIYVKPEYRGKLSVSRMIRALEVWAIEQGCKHITMPLLDTMPKRTRAVYEGSGYRSLQEVFIKDL